MASKAKEGARLDDIGHSLSMDASRLDGTWGPVDVCGQKVKPKVARDSYDVCEHTTKTG